MKICMIGAGRIGTVHAIAIASDANAILHSVVDFHQESAEKLALYRRFWRFISRYEDS